MPAVVAFLSDERGTETIQFVAFVPLFVILLIIITDASFLYVTHSEMWQVSRDTARRMVAGQLTSQADAEAFAADRLDMFENAYTIEAHFDPDAYMSVFIETDIADAMVFGTYLKPILGNALRVRVTMRSEPEIATGGGGGGGA